MSDNKFISGLFFKDPHENAPEFVMAKGSIKVRDLIDWLQQQDGEWINFDLKRSREGKPYASIDSWVPANRQPPQGREVQSGANPAHQGADRFDDSDIPF